MQQQGCILGGSTIYPNFSYSQTVNSDKIDYYANSNPLQVCFYAGQGGCDVPQTSISGVGRNCIVNGMYGRVVNYSMVNVPLDTNVVGGLLMACVVVMGFFRISGRNGLGVGV